MGLVADALHELQLRCPVIKQDRLLRVREPDGLELLREAEHRHLRADGLQRVHGKAHLLRAAVDQHQIRQVGELPTDRRETFGLALGFLLQPMGEAPPEHLVQGSEVVRAFHRLDPELPVLLLRRDTVDKHHHGSDGQHALGG